MRKTLRSWLCTSALCLLCTVMTASVSFAEELAEDEITEAPVVEDVMGNEVWTSVGTVDTNPYVQETLVYDVTDEGYSVSMRFSAPQGLGSVKLATWTDAGGQDDIVWQDMTISGQSAVCRVQTGSHGNETGKYLSHVYLWDSYGNSDVKALEITVPAHPAPVITSVTVSDISSDGYRVTAAFTSANGVSKVLMPTWTEKNGQDDLIWHEASVSGSTATFYVRTGSHGHESGKYITHVYVYDQAGNQAVSFTEATLPVPADPIHALSAAELNAIASRYSSRILGYGAPLSAIGADGYNNYARATQASIAQFNPVFFGNTTGKSVYLAFPSGWENGDHTAQILDALKAVGGKATFFVTHSYAASRPDLIRRMINEGHEIGSHSYAHPNNGLPSLSLQAQMEDTLKMQRYMKDTFGYTMRKYNLNSSYYSEQSLALLTQMGYEVVFYSFNYADYDVSKPTASGTVLSMLNRALKPGVILYLHAVSVGNTQALPTFIRQATAQGYTFDLIP